MTPPARRFPHEPDERGVALVMAILVLFVITVIGTLLMQNLSTERKITGYGMRASRALGIAEAGVSEVLSRVASGEISMDEAKPQSVVQIFLAGPGAAPHLGADSTGLSTLQPSGEWLEYSTPGRDAGALTLAFERDATTGAIRRYDDTRNPAWNSATGMPVFSIRSTGRAGNARACVVTDVVLQPLHPVLGAALTSGVNVALSGGVAICGYRHSMATPFGDGVAGRSGTPTCQGDEVGVADVPAIWTGGAVTNNGGVVAGSPTATLQQQAGFFAGPWEAVGMTQAEFTTALGTAKTAPASYDDVVYMDNNSTAGDASGAFTIAGLQGSGLLYVDGDLTLTGAVSYRGLIYVEGNLVTNATGSVIGGVVVRGRAGGTCSLATGPAILSCPDAVNEGLARKIGRFARLSWREVR